MSLQEPRDRQIWKWVAFLGRYGHQPLNLVLEMAFVDMSMLAEEVGMLIEQEYPKTHER